MGDFGFYPPIVPARVAWWRADRLRLAVTAFFAFTSIANIVLAQIGWSRIHFFNHQIGKLQRVEKELFDTANKVPGWDKYADLALIHMPPDGHCPRGFEVAEHVFERDGATYAGCMRPVIGVGGAVDVLKPGESINFTFAIPLPPGGRLPKRGQEQKDGSVRQ